MFYVFFFHKQQETWSEWIVCTKTKRSWVSVYAITNTAESEKESERAECEPSKKGRNIFFRRTKCWLLLSVCVWTGGFVYLCWSKCVYVTCESQPRIVVVVVCSVKIYVVLMENWIVCCCVPQNEWNCESIQDKSKVFKERIRVYKQQPIWIVLRKEILMRVCSSRSVQQRKSTAIHAYPQFAYICFGVERYRLTIST